MVYIELCDFTKIHPKYIMKSIEYESEMTLWDVNGTTLKRKKPKKIKIQVEFMPNSAKEIYVAAKSGEPNPESNQALRLVLERAKTYSVPNHIIDRAIDKAKGAGEENYDHLRYEGFGPSGSMLIVDALTNNVNRTASDVRAAFGKMAVTWACLVQSLTCLTIQLLLVLKVNLPMKF